MKKLTLALQLGLCSALTLLTHSAYSQGSGHALSFDGNDYVQTNASIDDNLSTGFTISTWVNNVATASRNVIVSNFDGQGTQNGFSVEVRADGRAYVFVSQNSGANYIGRASSVYNWNAGWNHISVTYNGGNAPNSFNVYVNGILDNNIDLSSGALTGLSQSPYPLEMGRVLNFSGFTGYFSGEMDELAVYERVFTTSEIRENMCQRRIPSSTDLVAYYRMDEGIDNSCSGGEDVCDLTGNGNHGTKF